MIPPAEADLLARTTALTHALSDMAVTHLLSRPRSPAGRSPADAGDDLHRDLTHAAEVAAAYAERFHAQVTTIGDEYLAHGIRMLPVVESPQNAGHLWDNVNALRDASIQLVSRNL